MGSSVTMASLVSTLQDLGFPTLIGVVLGAGLNYAFAKRVRRDERDWAVEQEVRAREAAAVDAFDTAFADERDVIARLEGELSLAETFGPSFERLKPLWSRYGLRIRDELLARRVQSVVFLLLILSEILSGNRFALSRSREGAPLSSNDAKKVATTVMTEAREATTAFLIGGEAAAERDLIVDELFGLFDEGDPVTNLADMAQRIRARD